MFDETRTTHVQIAGLARSDVRDVRILYKDEQSAKRDAPVDFVSVTGAVRERAGANAPSASSSGSCHRLGWAAAHCTTPGTAPRKNTPTTPRRSK
jgi:hypothetical protein